MYLRLWDQKRKSLVQSAEVNKDLPEEACKLRLANQREKILRDGPYGKDKKTSNSTLNPNAIISIFYTMI